MCTTQRGRHRQRKKKIQKENNYFRKLNFNKLIENRDIIEELLDSSVISIKLNIMSFLSAYFFESHFAAEHLLIYVFFMCENISKTVLG